MPFLIRRLVSAVNPREANHILGSRMQIVNRWVRVIRVLAAVIAVPFMVSVASAESRKLFGYNDNQNNVVLIGFRGANISSMSLAFRLTCEILDSHEEFQVDFVSSSFYGTGGLNRRKALAATLVFEDGSGRSVNVVASGNFRATRPFIHLEVTPVAGDLEVCDPFVAGFQLNKLRTR